MCASLVICVWVLWYVLVCFSVLLVVSFVGDCSHVDTFVM